MVKLNVGASAMHDSADILTFVAENGEEIWFDESGVDATIEVPKLNWKVWGEFTAVNRFTDGTSPTGGPSGLTGGTGPAGSGSIGGHAEGWYVTSCMQPLKFFMRRRPRCWKQTCAMTT